MKIGRFLARKRQIFTFFALRFWYRFFHGKRNNSIKNAPIDLIFGIQPPYSACNKSTYGIFEILNFHWVMTHFVDQRGKFSSILVIFCKKNAILAYKSGHNTVKIQNFQNPIRNFVADTIGKLYTKNQVNWNMFDWVITFSVEKAVPKSQREKRKNLLFSGQKSANFQNFSNFFINLYIKTRAGCHEDVHVSGHNSRTEHPMNLSYGILDCPWKGLYDRVENKPFWRKRLYPPPPGP